LKEVSARFAEEHETDLESKGFKKGESDLGSIYYKPEDIVFGPQPGLKLLTFWWAKHILALDMRPAA